MDQRHPAGMALPIMDDQRTKETLDALADLFLTGTTPPSRRPAEAPVRTPPRRQPPAPVDDAPPAPAAPAASASTSVLDELDGPDSIPLGKPNTSAARYSDDDYHPEPGPALKLHDDSADDSRAPQPAHIEAVFLGNLPGFAGPWLTQYAFHLAQQRGPVAVLHLAGSRADLEVVTAQRQTVRPGAEDVLPNDADLESLIARLDRLARDGATPVATWLIHLPSPTDPAQLARAGAIPHWTVLCGSDDMAVAAATRMLQSLIESTGAGDAAAQSRMIGVMIMGSDEPKAREAIDKFNAAAVGYLRQPIELLGSRRQMTPVHMRTLGGAGGADLWPALHAFLTDLPVAEPPAGTAAAAATDTPTAPASAAATSPAPLATPTPSTPESEPPVYDTHASAVLEPPSEIEHLTGHAFKPAAAIPAPQPAASQSTSPRAPRSAPIPAAPEPAPSSVSEPNLVDLLATGALPGGVALQARHPKQRDTQLLLDQTGKLHLLRRQLGSDLRAAIIDLMETRDWVREHIELIALTQRQCAFDTIAEPTLHLFTADAKNAVAMVSKLGPYVKLHLLQEVRVGSMKTWVCTDLN